MTSSELWSDGNALASPFHDVFCVEVTTAIGRCANCGRTGPMAELRVFDHAPGVVVQDRRGVDELGAALHLLAGQLVEAAREREQRWPHVRSARSVGALAGV